MDDTIAIIPARSGSKGIPNKNIALLNGVPLIAYTIAVLKLVGIKKIILSTDSKEYKKIALEYGAEVPFLRPKKLSGDTATDYQFMVHAMNWVSENEVSLPEYWLHMRPTTPLRDPDIILKAIKSFKEQNLATSLRSGHEAPESPFKWFLKDDDGFFKGFRADLTASKVNLPRQVFPSVYIPNGYIDIVRSSYVMQNEDLHGYKMFVFETPPVNEIDTIEDFNFIDHEAKTKFQHFSKYFNA